MLKVGVTAAPSKAVTENVEACFTCGFCYLLFSVVFDWGEGYCGCFDDAFDEADVVADEVEGVGVVVCLE